MKFDTKGQETWVTNTDVEREGVWFFLTSEENAPGFKIAFAHRSNPDYASAFEKAARPYRKHMAVDASASAKYGDKIMRETFANAIIKDWKNITAEGQQLEASFDNKLAYLEAFPRVFDKLLEVAKEPEYFSDASLVGEDMDKGNSKASSAGN